MALPLDHIIFHPFLLHHNYVPSTISRASTPITSKSDNSSISACQLELMNALNMDQGLVSAKGSRSSLETMWKRYVTIMKAITKVGELRWASGRKPADSEVIGIYGGKSMFYEQVRVLQRVKLYSAMVEWLERSDLDEDNTTNLWGYYKMMYTLKDLEKWLDQKQREADQKVKKKVTRSQKGKRSDGDESSSPKKSHKKSAGGCK